MLSRLLALSALTTLIAIPAHAKCIAEDWVWRYNYGYVELEGVSNCAKGRVRARMYEGEGDKRTFIGLAYGYLDGYTFIAMGQAHRRPKPLWIAFDITPE